MSGAERMAVLTGKFYRQLQRERLQRKQARHKWRQQTREREGARRLEDIAKVIMRPSRTIQSEAEKSQIELVSLEDESLQRPETSRPKPRDS